MAVHGFCGAFEIQDMLQSPSPTLCLRIFKLTNPPHLWTVDGAKAERRTLKRSMSHDWGPGAPESQSSPEHIDHAARYSTAAMALSQMLRKGDGYFQYARYFLMNWFLAAIFSIFFHHNLFRVGQLVRLFTSFWFWIGVNVTWWYHSR